MTIFEPPQFRNVLLGLGSAVGAGDHNMERQAGDGPSNTG